MWSMNRTPLRWSISCCRQVREQAVGLDLVLLCRRGRGISPSPAPAARPPRNIPGSTGSLPRRSSVSSDDHTISGLMNTCGSFGSSFLARSMVTTRLRHADLDRRKPDAGRVVHGLEHVVDERRECRRRTLSTGSEISRSRLSGRMRMSRRAMARDVRAATARSMRHECACAARTYAVALSCRSPFVRS